VTAVGVTLCEVLDAPSWGTVLFRIPSGQRTTRWRVALGDIHLSGDIRSLHVPGARPGRITCTAMSCTRASMDLADCTTAGLAHQGGGYSRSRAAVSDMYSAFGDPASWKDPL
jgi:hypothetical protein